MTAKLCKIKRCMKKAASKQAYCTGHRTAINRYVWRLAHNPSLLHVLVVAVGKWQKGAKGRPHRGRTRKEPSL